MRLGEIFAPVAASDVGLKLVQSRELLEKLQTAFVALRDLALCFDL